MSRTGISPNPEKIKAITDLARRLTWTLCAQPSAPSATTASGSPTSPQVTEPLTRLTKQWDLQGLGAEKVKLRDRFVPFVWGEAEDKAFMTLKQALVNAPSLGHPDFHLRFYLQTDASDIGLGGCCPSSTESVLSSSPTGPSS